jgi:hypothetical membrane protein
MNQFYEKIFGALLFVGTVQFVILMNVAEQLYPGYSVSLNYISDLGATCRRTCQIVQPTAVIFNSSIVLLGLLMIIGAYCVRRSFRSRPLTALLMLTGIGALGVGLFPETTGIIHHIFSAVVFLFGGLSAIASFQIAKRPMSYLSTLMGLVTLVALALYLSNIFLGLGPGGMERMIAYPALLWGVGLGGHLMHT